MWSEFNLIFIHFEYQHDKNGDFSYRWIWSGEKSLWLPNDICTPRGPCQMSGLGKTQVLVNILNCRKISLHFFSLGNYAVLPVQYVIKTHANTFCRVCAWYAYLDIAFVINTSRWWYGMGDKDDCLWLCIWHIPMKVEAFSLFAKTHFMGKILLLWR